MSSDTCPVRLELSDAVSKAVEAVYRAKANQVEAVRDEIDSDPATVRLADARTAERNAVKDLDAHRKEHHC